MSAQTSRTLAELFLDYAAERPDSEAYSFLTETSEETLTRATLERKARALASQLQSEGLKGERVLLMYPPGPEYLVALWACVLAGAVAVPLPAPRGKRLLGRLELVLSDSNPAAALVPDHLKESAEELMSSISSSQPIRYLGSTSGDAETWKIPDISPHDLAVVQYTSGSTTEPRGVQLDHRNLLSNCAALQWFLRCAPDERTVSWLPLYHDMGLLLTVLQPVFDGRPCTLMAPADFSRRPQLWLETISKTRASVSGGPNFAFELAAAQTSPEERAALDLSSWRVAYVGAEPIQSSTLDRFAQAFSESGFQPEALMPGYGLAEATLVVTMRPRVSGAKRLWLDKAALEAGKVALGLGPGSYPVVGCGVPPPGTQISIIDPETGQAAAPDRAGEVVVVGPGVSRGYFGAPERSALTFQKGKEAGNVLHTGDLGFISEGELYILGRRKDLLIFQGRNVYPQDVEWTAMRADPEVAGAAAFSGPREDELVVLVEAAPRPSVGGYEKILDAMRNAISADHEVAVSAAAVVRRGALLRTSSGKIQRQRCREAYLAGSLRTLAAWPTKPDMPRTAARGSFLEQLKGLPSGQRRKLLLNHLQGMAGRILKIPDVAAVDCRAPLRQLGLTSLMATELALELGLTLQCPCTATLLFNYPTIEKLTDHLLSEGIANSVPAPEAASSRENASDSAVAEMVSVVSVIPEGTSGLPQANSAELAEPIAIIGLACRFPGGAATPEDYWHILRGGVDAITEVPSDRWNISDFYDPNPETPGKMYSRWGGFLDSIDLFDAAYFGISPREAAVLDPQQRLLLEVTVEALENAGQAPDPQNPSNVGVFVGIMNSNDFVSVKGTSSDPSRVNAHDSTGQATSAAAGRLSYALGFQGPSMAIDTACSSSLVAIHLACQSLRSKECQMAVAGGVNVIIAPEITISFCKTRMLSPTGRCKTFDAGADGYVRGEGCGVIVLKRFSDAVRDKDNILALIRGSAVNQDGRSSSLTAPNGLAQQALVRQALKVAGIRPSEVDYIEAHGTGTALGDPIELEALGKVLGEGRDARHPFLVGSVKTNIGHLESAAGVAGLIKVILSLQNEEIPPHLHLEEVNPHISLTTSKACIPTCLTPWPRNGKRRVAGVSSFGFVGTNAHVVVEEAPEAIAGTQMSLLPVHRLLALSARSPEGLRELVGRYSRMLSRRSVKIDDLCYTANTGRVHHEVRAAITAANTDVLRKKLGELMGEIAARPITSGSSTGKIAFLFTGQGAQYQFMGRKLFEVEPVFRGALERCAQIIDPLLQTSLIGIIHGENPEILNQTQFAQPALFALEYALFEQWRAWGIEPAMVMGHSLGEYAAAVAAQVLSLEQAAKLVVTRGRLMQSVQTPGGSAAVFASEDFVRPYLEPHLDAVAIAADNAPERVLIAGERKRLEMICDALKAKGIEVRPMIGLAAPHCPLMDPILDTFEAIAGMATYNPPAIPMVSTATAQIITPAELSNPRLWRDLVRNKVRFREGMQVLHNAGCRVFLEIGPRHTLIRLGEMCLPFPDLTWLASLRKEKHDQEQMLESLGQLYTRGVEVHWAERHRPFAGRKIALPTTVFEKRQFWPERAAEPVSTPAQFAPPVQASNGGLAELLGRRLRSPLEQVQFEARVDLASLPMLEDHRILGMLLMPGAAQIVRVLAAAEQLTGRRHLELRDALFPEPMMLGDSSDTRIAQLILAPKEDGYDFKISSVAHADEDHSGWRVHATGHIVASDDEDEEVETTVSRTVTEEISNLDPSAEQFSGDDFYALQAKNGYVLGPTFRWLKRVWLGKDDVLAMLRMPRELTNNTWQSLHPGLIDSCLQAASRLANIAPDMKDQSVLVPAAISGFRLFGDRVEKALQGHLYCRVSSLGLNEGSMSLRLKVFDESGNVVFSISELHLRQLSSRNLLGGTAAKFDESLRRIVWSDSELVASPLNGRGRWLIFADEGGTGAALAGMLRDRGHDAVMVFKAQPSAKNGECLRLNAANQPEFKRQLAQMQPDCGTPWQGTVYLWGLDASGKPIKECTVGDNETSGCLGLLNLAKAMINATACPPVWVVTRGAQRTQRESKLGAISQAMLWGLGRVFASEHSLLLGGLVDLDPHALLEDAAAQLLEELWPRDGDTQAAYRGGKRLVPRLRPLGRGNTRSRFHARSDASYLITGAFGALGRKVAEWLVVSGARHLALLSRRPPDDEATRWLQRLREQGVQLLPLQADVAVMAELAEALAQIDRIMPPLRGVMHAAGILEDNTVSKLEWTSFARVQAPKVEGSWNLHTLTQDRPLDFWVIFSSVASLVGNPGQAAYGAGNAYADALAHHRRMQGAPALSINWGPWKGEGMSSQHTHNLYRRWGLLPIDPSEGVEMLGQLLSIDIGQAWAAPLDVDLLMERSAESPHLSLMAELVGGPKGRIPSPGGKAVANEASKLKDLPDDQRQAAVLEHVADLVRSVTGMEASEPVRVDARLETIGVDSLLTVDLLNALSRFFGLNLPATILINCPTIELLAKYLCEEIARNQKPDHTLLLDRSVPGGADLLNSSVSVSP